MGFRPLHDRVLVRRVEAEEKTSGGIIIPDTAKEKPQEGEVIAVGAGTRDESGKLVELDVKPGDRILFGKWSGTEVRLEGEDLLIMKESDILGIIEGSAEIRKAALVSSGKFVRDRGKQLWLPKTSSFRVKRASASCAAWTSSPTR
jgi:chaperonin GroES